MCENIPDVFLEKRAIIDSAREKAMKDLWVCAFKDHYRNHIEELAQFASPEERGILDNYSRKIRNGIKFAFFTVNVREGVYVEFLMDKISKMLSKCWIKEYMYCIEQRGENEETMGSGLHAHILVSLNKYKRPSDCKREVYNTFRNLVDNKLHVNMRSGMDGKNFANYILGNKSHDKMDKVDMDILWRENMGIENVYSSDLDFFEEMVIGRRAPP